MNEQEKLIIKYICLGLSNQEIRERMGWDIPTVKKYVNEIFAKYNVYNRIALTIKVLCQKSMEERTQQALLVVI